MFTTGACNPPLENLSFDRREMMQAEGGIVLAGDADPWAELAALFPELAQAGPALGWQTARRLLKSYHARLMVQAAQVGVCLTARPGSWLSLPHGRETNPKKARKRQSGR